MRWLASIALCAACTDNTISVTPVIDVPTNDTASAFPLDSITVSIAHDGSNLDLVSQTFGRGATIEIPNVPFGDDLVMHLTGRVGASEVAYGRTCRFSVRADGRAPAPHLYLSRAVKFGALSQRPLAREAATALTFSDGSGLTLGGTVPGDVTASIRQVERFDPNTGEYETLHEIEPRIGAAVALLGDTADARVVVIGGLDPATNMGAGFVEILDADRNTDRQYEKFDDGQIRRVGLTATRLVDGRVIAIGGRPPGGVPAMDATVVEVAVISGTPVVRATRATLLKPRYGHTATRLADDLGAAVLVVGGLDTTGAPIAAAELYKPLAEGFSLNFNRSMIVPRSRHQAVRLPDGSVLIVGGVGADGLAVKVIELFSLDAGFQAVAGVVDDLPPNLGLVDLSATTLPDGRVLLTGGRLTVDGPPITNAFIARLDPQDGTVDVVATDRLANPRAAHQATLLCDGTVLISGGTLDQTRYERYNPPSLGRR